MKSLSLENRTKAESDSPLWIDKFAKKVVLNLMAQIKIGHLRVEDGQEVYDFGESPAATDLSARIVVAHPSIYRMVLFNGSIGSGEAYMQKVWSSPDLLQVIRLMVLNMAMLDKMDSQWSFLKKFLNKYLHYLNRNSRSQAQQNISAHYDLGNDFFRLFLDNTMQYSAAIFKNENASLAEASRFKAHHIGERLQLQASDHLLEIGCGWGGLAIQLAKEFGCKITSITISKEQFEYARNWVAEEGLDSLVDVQFMDYRDVQGKFDKIVSIEMIEAVGHQYYKEYFSQCSSLLKEDGLMLIQAITIADQRYEQAKNNMDFIQKYIFPGGSLPSNEVITQCLNRYTDMQLVGLEDITKDYAKTLAFWKHNFKVNLVEVKKLGYSDAFIKMWEFYLNYCEGGFMERVISTSQLIFAKPMCRRLPAI